MMDGNRAWAGIGMNTVLFNIHTLNVMADQKAENMLSVLTIANVFCVQQKVLLNAWATPLTKHDFA